MREVGVTLLHYWRQMQQDDMSGVTQKDDLTPLTEADIKANEQLVAGLIKIFL